MATPPLDDPNTSNKQRHLAELMEEYMRENPMPYGQEEEDDYASGLVAIGPTFGRPSAPDRPVRLSNILAGLRDEPLCDTCGLVNPTKACWICDGAAMTCDNRLCAKAHEHRCRRDVVCAKCHKREEYFFDPVLRRCSGCTSKKVYYCSQECQREHWKESHRKECEKKHKRATKD